MYTLVFSSCRALAGGYPVFVNLRLSVLWLSLVSADPTGAAIVGSLTEAWLEVYLNIYLMQAGSIMLSRERGRAADCRCCHRCVPCQGAARLGMSENEAEKWMERKMASTLCT